MKSEKFAWETKHEIAFLNKIGTWGAIPNRLAKSKPELVQQYLDAMFARKNWGDIDKKKVEDHCFNMIAGRTS
jgi:hypothetical protein